MDRRQSSTSTYRFRPRSLANDVCSDYIARVIEEEAAQEAVDALVTAEIIEAEAAEDAKATVLASDDAAE